MPWNQPGGNDRDPWSGGDKNRQGPPDLDELFKKLTRKLGSFGGSGGGDGGDGSGVGRAGSAGIIGLVLLGLIIWAASGFYIVGEGERGVVLRLGKFQSVADPGPHWHLPTPVDKVEMVDIDQVRSFSHRTSMLTQDENIVDIELAVQYRIKDPVDFTFRVRAPELTLQQAVESALREAVGKQKMDFVLNEGRAQIASKTKELAVGMLDAYTTGLEVTTVNLQQSQPPEHVQDAFNDAIKAREDNVRFVNEAEAYSNSIIPRARGKAARVTEEAQAYKEQVIAEAKGDASRFSQVALSYERSPGVTRERLYIEAVESVLGNASKVMVDVKSGNSLMYLPLDKLGIQSQTAKESGNFVQQTAPLTSQNSSQLRSGRPMDGRTGRESR